MAGWVKAASAVMAALLIAAPAAAQLPLPGGLGLPQVAPLPTDPLTDRLGGRLGRGEGRRRAGHA